MITTLYIFLIIFVLMMIVLFLACMGVFGRKEKKVNCTYCKGKGKIMGLFPVYGDDVPQSERKPTVTNNCPICDGAGNVDEEFPMREKMGNEVRWYRINHNLTLRKFSEEYGVEVGALSAFERGKKIDGELGKKFQEIYEKITTRTAI